MLRTYLGNGTIRCLGLAECDKSAILFDLHRDIDDVAVVVEMLFERVLGDAFALHEDCVTGFWLFFVDVGFLIAWIFFFFKGLIKCWNCTT